MTLWTIVLLGSGVSFVAMLIFISGGALRELRMTLDELREDTRESAEHPEILEEAI